MFPTQTDLAFYQSKTQPKWAQKLKRREPTWETIDIVVNAHAGVRHSDAGEIAAGNLLAILRSYRRRKLNLVSELRKIAANPECLINTEKRAAFARKWLRRLEAA